MFEFTAKVVNNTRSNAKCAVTGEKIDGRQAYRVYLPRTGEQARYVLAENWETTYTAEEAARVVVGKDNNNHLRYQVVCEGKIPDCVRAALICPTGSQPAWYPTEKGFASPTYRNAKWHDRIEAVADQLKEGTIWVRITTMSGKRLETVKAVKLHFDRNGMGQFLKATEKGCNKSHLLELIDDATADWKGYRNH